MSKEVCVTAGTGFIAGHLIRELLQRGYRVRTTVRNPGMITLLILHGDSIPSRGILVLSIVNSNISSVIVMVLGLEGRSDNVEKISYLWDLPGAVERLKVVKADLLEEGSFDAAVEGAHGVFHTASPVLPSYDEHVQETLIDPAVKGTLNVLKSCSRSSSVKRVVITSSCSAIRYDYDTQQKSPLNESHWSNPEYCKHYNLWYPYAKTMAEKEAWKFAEEQGLDLVVVNPSFVAGPMLAPKPTSTLSFALSIIRGEKNKVYPNIRLGFVHIDDVITAHILAMEVPSASGRFICSGDVAHLEEIVEMLRNKYPMYPIADRCGGEEGNAIPHTMDTSKIRSLGLTNFKSIEQVFEDCVTSFQAKGLLQSTDHHEQA